MKQNSLLCRALALTALLLAACQPATPTQAPQTTTINTTVTATISPTSTRKPTKTPAPTDTPLPIPPALTAIPVQPDPLALNESNAGTEMKLLHTWGTGALNQAVFSPKGKYLAAATGRGVYLYDGQTFELVKLIDVGKSVTALAFSPDEAVLALGTEGQVSLWNVASGAQMQILQSQGLLYPHKIVYSKGGFVAATGDDDCTACTPPASMAVVFWNTDKGQAIYSEKHIPTPSTALTFLEDGETAIFRGKRGLMQINLVTKEINTLQDIQSANPYFVNADEAHRRLFIFGELSGATSWTVWAVHLDTKEVTQLSLCNSNVTLANNIAACISEAMQVSLFDPDSFKVIKTIPAELDDIFPPSLLALRPDGKVLIVQNQNNIQILDTQTGSHITTLHFDNFRVSRVGLLQLDGSTRPVAVFSSFEKPAAILDLETGKTLRSLELGCGFCENIAIAPDQKTIVSNDNGYLAFGDANTGQVNYKIPLPTEFFAVSIVFFPDGKGLLMVNSQNEVYKLDLPDATWTKYNSFNVWLSPSSHPIVFSDQDTPPQFTDTVTQEMIPRPTNITGYSMRLAISPDNELYALRNENGLFTWSKGKTSSRWQLDQAQLGDAWELLFAPHSHLLVSFGSNTDARLWNAKTGQLLRALENDSIYMNLNFTPDGRYLVIGGDGVLYVWGLPE